jgi:hypothetical protein
MLRLLEALFVAVSGVSALAAVFQAREGRAEERADAWRRERERYLDLLADALLAVGEEAIRVRAQGLDLTPEYEAAQLRLRRALTDALTPLIEFDAIADVSGEPASIVTTELVEEALNEVAGTVNRIRVEAAKSPRQRRREFRHALRR